MIRTDIIKQVKVDDIIYILDTEAKVIEDAATEYVVPLDSFIAYKELNPSLNIRGYNYNSYRVTKEPFYNDIAVIMTTESNAPVLSVMYSKGLCSNQDYMTLAEAMQVTNDKLTSLFEGNLNITHFEEFQYFIGVTEVGARMFYNAYNLEKIILPKTCKKICDKAFVFATANLVGGKVNKLSYIGGLENVESVGYNSFQYCYNIKEYNFTDKLKHIGINCFCGVENNTSAHGKHTQTVSFGDLSGVEKLSDESFYHQVNMKHLNLSNASVICGREFMGCENLETIQLDWKNINPTYTTIDSSINSLEEIFRDCHNLQKIESMPLVKIISKGFCGNCYKLKYVGDFPSCTKIEQYAFTNCDDLESIGNLDKVQIIEKYAFATCENLKEINLPICNSVGEDAFGFQYEGEDKNRIVRFGLPYESITFHAKAFENSTHTTIYCNGIELTAEQYQAIGAKKPVKEGIEEIISSELEPNIK